MLPLGCVLAALFPAGPALSLDPARVPTQYRHQHWGRDQGLPSSAVLAVHQTRDGFLWLGTYDGLVRFDGLSFTVFDPSNTRALRNSSAWRLLEGRDGTLWIGTNGGGLVALRHGRFTAYGTASGLGSDVVTALGEDSSGALYVGSRLGLERVRVSPSGLAVERVETEQGGPVGNVLCIGSDGAGSILVGTAAAVFAVDAAGNPPRAVLRARLDVPVWAIQADSRGSVWVGTGGEGLLEWRGGTERRFAEGDGLGSNVVSALAVDRDGNLWIGTDGAGLVRRRDGRFDRFGVDEGLSGSSVVSLAQDREGSLWVGLARRGLDRLQDGKVLTYTVHEGLPSDVTTQVYEDRDGSVWVATVDGAARLAAGGFRTVTPPGSDRYVRAVFRDRAGTLWLATRGHGLLEVDESRFAIGKRALGKAAGLPTEHARAVAEDASGRLWVGTSGGLAVREGDRFRPVGPADGVPATQVLALLPAARGGLWVGTDGAGLVRLGSGKPVVYTTRDGLPSDVVLGLFEDERGVLWAATNGGLGRFDGKRFAKLGRAQGLLSDLPTQLLSDGLGNLWVGGNGGIARLPLAELDAVAAGKRPAATAMPFGLPEGMKSDECNAPALPCRTRDGRLWFATTRGVAAIDPVHLRRNPLPPKVVLSSVRAAGTERTPRDGLTLEPGVRRLEILLRRPEPDGAGARPGPLSARGVRSGVDRSGAPPRRLLRGPSSRPVPVRGRGRQRGRDLDADASFAELLDRAGDLADLVGARGCGPPPGCGRDGRREVETRARRAARQGLEGGGDAPDAGADRAERGAPARARTAEPGERPPAGARPDQGHLHGHARPRPQVPPHGRLRHAEAPPGGGPRGRGREAALPRHL